MFYMPQKHYSNKDQIKAKNIKFKNIGGILFMFDGEDKSDYVKKCIHMRFNFQWSE